MSCTVDKFFELEHIAARSRAQRPSIPLCRDSDELHDVLLDALRLNVPRQAVCAGHSAPFEYMQTAYFEPAADQIVWAPRGGGKTRLAAAATLLDLLHKPAVQVRLLARAEPARVGASSSGRGEARL